MMIDAHVHVFEKVSSRFPRDVDDITPADREETAEQLLETMAATGVETANLVQIGGARDEQHAYLQHCLHTYPDRFRGIGVVEDPPHPEEQMDRLAGDGGIIGFRLFSIGGERDPLAPMDIRTFDTYIQDLETRGRTRLHHLALSTGRRESLRAISHGRLPRVDGGLQPYGLLSW